MAKAKKALTPDTINFKHPYSYDTPLHCAAASSFAKRKGVVEMLYRKGANLNDKNKVSVQPCLLYNIHAKYLVQTVHMYMKCFNDVLMHEHPN